VGAVVEASSDDAGGNRTLLRVNLGPGDVTSLRVAGPARGAAPGSAVLLSDLTVKADGILWEGARGTLGGLRVGALKRLTSALAINLALLAALAAWWRAGALLSQKSEHSSGQH
jgi:hypothetical protein